MSVRNLMIDYEITNQLTPSSRAPLEKLTVSQPVKKFPTIYGTRKFIAAFTSSHHLSLSSASLIHYMSSHLTSSRSILILSSHLRLGLPSGLFPIGFPHQNPVNASSPPHTCYMPSPFHSSRFAQPNNIW